MEEVIKLKIGDLVKYNNPRHKYIAMAVSSPAYEDNCYVHDRRVILYVLNKNGINKWFIDLYKSKFLQKIKEKKCRLIRKQNKK